MFENSFLARKTARTAKMKNQIITPYNRVLRGLTFLHLQKTHVYKEPCLCENTVRRLSREYQCSETKTRLVNHRDFLLCPTVAAVIRRVSIKYNFCNKVSYAKANTNISAVYIVEHAVIFYRFFRRSINVCVDFYFSTRLTSIFGPFIVLNFYQCVMQTKFYIKKKWTLCIVWFGHGWR